MSSIERHMRDLSDIDEPLSLLRLKGVPLHRFRRINIHFNPLLAPVNVGSGLELHYFKVSWPDQLPIGLTEQYQATLKLQ